MPHTLADVPDVTVCAPCDQGACCPESHAPGTRTVLVDRCPIDVPDETAIKALVYAVRNGAKVSGPITVHRGPRNDINAVTGQLVREWVATQP